MSFTPHNPEIFTDVIIYKVEDSILKKLEQHGCLDLDCCSQAPTSLKLKKKKLWFSMSDETLIQSDIKIPDVIYINCINSIVCDLTKNNQLVTYFKIEKIQVERNTWSFTYDVVVLFSVYLKKKDLYWKVKNRRKHAASYNYLRFS